jgi:predicted RNA-binding Zn-ribbon protein involved in translation (DUF1610 family)
MKKVGFRRSFTLTILKDKFMNVVTIIGLAISVGLGIIVDNWSPIVVIILLIAIGRIAKVFDNAYLSICPSCGKILSTTNATESFCASCGTELPKVKKSTPQEKP